MEHTEITNTFSDMNRMEIRFIVEELFAEYAHCIDQWEIDKWPDFFVDDCIYKLISRENYDDGFPICTILCESKGYLLDRVHAVQAISMFAPLVIRHLISGIRIVDCENGILKVEANFTLMRTQVDSETEVFLSGRYFDQLAIEDGKLLFKEKICVYDSIIIPNSVVLPV